VAAPWMQRFHRRTWLQVELALLGIAALFTTLAPSFEALIVARILTGLSGGAIMANCFTAAGEMLSDPGRRSRAVGIIASGTTLALLVGLPAVALVEDATNWRRASASTLIPVGLSLLGTVAIPLYPLAQSSESGSRTAEYRKVFGHLPTSLILAALALTFVAYVGWLTYYGAYVEHDFSVGAGQLGTLYFVGGASELLTNIAFPSLTRRVSISRLCLLGAAGMALALVGSGLIFTTVASLFVAISLLHVATSFTYVGSNTLLLESQPQRRGTVMAIASTMTGFGGALGALIGGIALSAWDDYEAVYRLLGVLIAIGAGCVLASGQMGEKRGG